MRLAAVVEDVLKNNPHLGGVHARDSDNVLIIMVLSRLGVYLDDHAKKVFMQLSFETITRCRRKLQEQGLYLSSEPVTKERKFKSMAMQQNTPVATPKRIEQVMGQHGEPPQEATQQSLLEVAPLPPKRSNPYGSH